MPLPQTAWAFHAAGSLVFGRGSADRLGALVAARLRARRVVVVTDANLVRLGLVDPVVRSLEAAGMSVAVFDGGVAEPPAGVVRAAVAFARGVAPDAVVGVGGGSNLDVAKLTALVLAHGGDVLDYAGEDRVPGPVLPVACVPTTAGTGSEVSPAAVVTDEDRGMKVSCLSGYLRPALAVVDPALTDGCPPKVTADSGVDVLTHAVEAFTAATADEFAARPGGASVYQGKNPVADLFAAECIRLVGRHLQAAVDDPADAAARDGMALAATLGGLAFSNSGVALCHALEYPVGAAVHVSHGAGNGLLLPAVMRFNLPVRVKEFARVGGLLGLTIHAHDAESQARDAVREVERLCRAAGIPARLRDLGVTRAQLPGFADKAFGLKRLMRVNPRAVESAAELEAVYDEVF